MKRLTLLVASGVVGLALLVGATRDAVAHTNGNIPPSNGTPCYYNMYTCSYEDSMAYWSGCSPDFSPGLITTTTAKSICTTFNEQ